MISAVVAAVLSSLAPLAVDIPKGCNADQIQQLISKAAGAKRAEQRLDVRFAGTEYFLNHAIDISTSNVRLIGKKGTVLSGAATISGWKELNPTEASQFSAESSKQIRVASIPGNMPVGKLARRGFGIFNRPSHSELFVDGAPMTLARYPNLDAPNGGWLKTGAIDGKWSFKDESARPTKWKNPGQAWTYGYWHFDWADSAEPMSGYDNSTHLATLQDTGDAAKGAMIEYGIEKGRRFFYFNVPEELDQPGEYWVDGDARKVYAYLPKGARSSRLSLTEGALIEGNHVDQVVVTGITLEGTRWTPLRVNECTNFVFGHGVIRNVGGTGASIEGGSKSGVFDSEITNCGESGVRLSGGSFVDLKPSANYVLNSYIHGVSRWCRTYRPAVSVDGVGQWVMGNTLSDLPHNAILFGGNDHKIMLNDIKRVCLETGDSGAIYAGRNPTTRGTMIVNNRFREIEPRTNTEGNYSQVMSVYLDDCQCGISVIGNVFESKGVGIMIGGGRDNVVEGNVFLDCNPGIHFDQRGKGWAKAMFTDSWGYLEHLKERPISSTIWKARYPALNRDVASGADLALAAGNVVAGNVQIGDHWIQYLDGLTEKNLDYRDNIVGSKAKTAEEAIRQIPDGYRKIDLKTIGQRKS